MLSVCSGRPRATIGKPRKGRCGSVAFGGVAGSTSSLVRQPQKQTQSLLAVPRRCGECGLSLRAFEGALHRCSDALEWPFGGEATASRDCASSSSSGCRVVRLGALAVKEGKTSPASETFEALWDFIHEDLSHGFHRPDAGSVAAGSSAVLLALRGRQVAGLIWLERIAKATLVAADGVAEEGAAMPPKAAEVPASLGVVLIWVRRTERRKGLASAMLDAARGCLASIGAPPVPVEQVAFSQTTDMGSLFARRYIGQAHQGAVLQYTPVCM
mmetsp:Transcript_64504/g.185458  ORF Transcript_64504/g.185458 Transcript_64504/m.185458 type:complete len:271 (+) Transcript_64504:71-883(+)